MGGGEGHVSQGIQEGPVRGATMTEWTAGLMIGVLVIGAGVLFIIWRYTISEWRAHRRDRREERREERGPR
jgi:hypothetical protein